MYCPACAQQNLDNATICINCGNRLPTMQMAQGYASASGMPYEKVDNHLVWAILATLFCCLPTGIVAIVYAAQVDSKVSAGDIAGARQSARNAATWSWVSFGLGLLFMLLYLGLVAFSIGLS